MRHFASSRFWTAYRALPQPIRALADKNFALLKADASHPSLHFKKVGNLYSVRVGLGYRALGVPVDEGLLWFWIGSHADYDAMLR
ncbi:MAG: hypothetical protein QM576_24735 [Rhodopseudomonas sp.]|uniref:ParE family toxin-like protein n=1 Tax=Rhodopseudomonas sp. TaxID=1078 RepID=UPI0039E4E5E5